MSDVQTTEGETKRDRVRQLLIQPLNERGFRKPGDVKADRFAKTMDRLCDELAYMSDDQLILLGEMLRGKGQGGDKLGWPRPATITALAEAVAPRPVEEHPKIASWFGSARGPKAQAEGTLVAEFLWLEKHKTPPFMETHWRAIREKASELDRQRKLALDRSRRNVARPDDARFLAWFDGIEARALALLPHEVSA
mgnify:CR=1 FL=1